MTPLTTADRHALLELARRALAYRLAQACDPTEEDLEIDATGRLAAPGAAFVTLKEGPQLRGCIGRLVAKAPLWRTVADMAIAAALHDYRFPIVRSDELDRIDITVSVLTSPAPVSGWQDIEIGRHGIVLKKGERSATFLPEVPVEHGWGLEHTLDRLALKAGIEEDGWRRDARFEVFEAEVFSDRESR